MNTPPITSFEGQYRFLSNFYLTPIPWGGLVYPSVEHAYQAQKCINPGDCKLFLTGKPGQAKRLGKTIPMIPNWDRVKVDVMRVMLVIKFANPDLKDLLLATGDAELIEGNDWGDRFWGVCEGQGLNTLGRLLMAVRELDRI